MECPICKREIDGPEFASHYAICATEPRPAPPNRRGANPFMLSLRRSTRGILAALFFYGFLFLLVNLFIILYGIANEILLRSLWPALATMIWSALNLGAKIASITIAFVAIGAGYSAAKREEPVWIYYANRFFILLGIYLLLAVVSWLTARRFGL